MAKAEPHSSEFHCMFDDCCRTFENLSAFKLHITEDHQEEEIMQQKEVDCDIDELDESAIICESDAEDEDDDVLSSPQQQSQQKPNLQDAERSALNGLLKLAKSSETQKNPKKEVKVSHIGTKKYHNTPVITLLNTRSPKNKKYPPAAPIVLAENATGQFYKGHPKSPQITHLSAKPIRSPISAISPRTDKQLAQEIEFLHHKHKRNRMCGKKRKISEMNSDELAHLTLKLQDKVSVMEASLQTAHKQLVIVRSLYRKKQKVSRKSH
eukprot:361105_1